ncbi:fused isobutyryl-CoA mutase/GTPase IcmF [Candidatus Riflebacteria bacterium]
METGIYKTRNKIRFVTAASLFDGHDAAINLVRRILQDSGVEVIHLGHNRSVGEIVTSALQEDVHAIAVSSYQGGHNEFFRYLKNQLVQNRAEHIKIFGGGGGVILPEEIRTLQQEGIDRIYSPNDGRKMGLQGMINDMLQKADYSMDANLLETKKLPVSLKLGREISLLENDLEYSWSQRRKNKYQAVVIGLTGTGGAGKSSLTDEILLRIKNADPDLKTCVLCVDPTKKKSGGALLGDRIRMNAIYSDNIYLRSMATRESATELSRAMDKCIELCKDYDFDIIFLETSGIGQGGSAVEAIADISLYVMTSEYGASSQLEKIDMLDFADFVVVNKFDKPGSEDAYRDVLKQYQRSRKLFAVEEQNKLPVYGTMASKFNDNGVSALTNAIIKKVEELSKRELRLYPVEKASKNENPNCSRITNPIIPGERNRYLAEIARYVRNYHAKNLEEAEKLRKLYQLKGALSHLSGRPAEKELQDSIESLEKEISAETKRGLDTYRNYESEYKQDSIPVKIRNKTIEVKGFNTSLSGLKIPKVSMPRYSDWGDQYLFIRKENLPGYFPFTAGVFPFRREFEDPKRMFAGEGGPARTNKRFHYLSKDSKAKRLSTAFDSVTLYGEDPSERPDIMGKIGESGVSICTLEDMEILFTGFDLSDPFTSVSLTINGPAPILLAMYFITALKQNIKKTEKELQRDLTASEIEELRLGTFKKIRGTVQADILKEDQAQNTCIFSIEFSLKLMGDIQEYFIKNGVRNYYSVSISGYHIAEAGANPISQLAFTLANGFTFLEYYLARGMKIDEFAHNLSFFFSNGLDPEYSVIGRVARRIWAVVLKERYGANERSQKLKYHIQTSGRSLHAMEVDFNDIRTTLQALIAFNDNCNSLHTNAFDEAITTPTEDSVRRAMAIQLIISKEFGLGKSENPSQGSFIMEELTDLVEEAVLTEFERISERGGVIGAMERQYQRLKIQDESAHYEHLKHTGELPIMGVNTFINPDENLETTTLEVARASQEEKNDQLQRLRAFQDRDRKKADKYLEELKIVARKGGNVFEVLLEAVKYASLGEISHALYEVGGQYRRSM